MTGPDSSILADIHAEAFDAPWDTATLTALLGQPGVQAIATPDGFILIRVVADEAEVLTLAVRTPARGRGLGTLLVSEAITVARAAGADRLFLEVADDNRAARALYGRLGFGTVGRRRSYYARREGDPVDALILSKSLSSHLP
ncbi:GNAT family N-acetyltransferase [Rhizobium sp. CRIBSB]|nr:GNAT family N-acetyltransferase [Rhizobium sp. CRIBSB]